MPNQNNDPKKELLNLIHEAMRQDLELREQNQIGEKFRFIRDRLVALKNRIEESLSETQVKNPETTSTITDQEVLVYVYLFNAQGSVFNTWLKMVNPSVFYDYSINRPIYLDKAKIETVIRNKANKLQHGYLTIAINKHDVLTSMESQETSAIVKIREGSLRFERLFGFTFNGANYLINEKGELKTQKS